MGTKHTPGPWTWFERTPGRPYLATPDRGQLYVLGFERKGMQGAGPVFSHWDGVEGGANRGRKGGVMEPGLLLRDGSMHPDARLIAAAPDLLAALDGMLAIVSDSRGVDGYHLNGEIAEWDYFDEIAAARAAITKATGAAA